MEPVPVYPGLLLCRPDSRTGSADRRVLPGAPASGLRCGQRGGEGSAGLSPQMCGQRPPLAGTAPQGRGREHAALSRSLAQHTHTHMFCVARPALQTSQRAQPSVSLVFPSSPERSRAPGSTGDWLKECVCHLLNVNDLRSERGHLGCAALFPDVCRSQVIGFS